MRTPDRGHSAETDLVLRLLRAETYEMVLAVATVRADWDDAIATHAERTADLTTLRIERFACTDERMIEALDLPAPDTSDRERVSEWRSRLHATGSPPEPQITRSGLVTPVVVNREVIGVLHLWHPGPPLEDIDHAVAVADGLAIGVQDAVQLYWRRWQARRLALLAERERIAGDLHDTASRTLSGLAWQIAQWAAERPQDRWADRLHTLAETVTTANTQVRDAATAYLPSRLEGRDLSAALRRLIDRYAERSGIDIDVEIRDGDVDPPVAEALYRVADEALLNITRHSNADRAYVRLDLNPDQSHLVVRDERSRPTPATPEQNASGFGLETLTRLLHQLGGDLEIERHRTGFTVDARVPRSSRASA